MFYLWKMVNLQYFEFVFLLIKHTQNMYHDIIVHLIRFTNIYIVIE